MVDPPRFSDMVLQQDITSIAEIKAGSRARLLRERRLVVVLDLDHTLLHTTHLENLSASEKHCTGASDVFHVHHDVTGCPYNKPLLTKLRPGVRRFLRDISGFFDIYIFTHGNRVYARDMAALLDFAGDDRIFSREDCNVDRIKTLDVIPEDAAMIVIIDDSKEVWDTQHIENVVGVTPYNYFASYIKQIDGADQSPKMSLAATGRDELDVGGVLERTSLLLLKLHHLFFDGIDDDPRNDVRRVLRRIRATSVGSLKL